MTSRPQWTPEQARDWYAARPWPVGCNYIPSNAINQLESRLLDLEERLAAARAAASPPPAARRKE